MLQTISSAGACGGVFDATAFRDPRLWLRGLSHRHPMYIVALLSTTLLAGCGSEGPVRVPVEGSVAFNGGGSLEAGVIRFIPTGETTGPVAVATIRDGSYELPESEGPVVGTHRIEIEAIDHYGFALDDESAYVAQIEQKRRRIPKNPVPERYNRRSMLTADVTLDGNHTFDFLLEPSEPNAIRR